MDKDMILQEKEAEVGYFRHYTTLGLLKRKRNSFFRFCKLWTEPGWL